MFNYKELSSLIYACPLSGKVSLIQTAGRILRECEKKAQPLVHTLIDNSFPMTFMPDYKRAKIIFAKEFPDAKMIDIEH